MSNPFLFIYGYRRLMASQASAGEIMNVCGQFGYVYRNFRFCGNYVCFECTYPTAKKLISACRDRGITVSVERERGFPDLLSRYRHRYGFFLGICLFFAIIVWSGSVVWDIRVEGNENLTVKEVKKTLADCGLFVGAKKDDIKAGQLENRVLIYSDEISWISVNMMGTVAEVEIREFQFPEKNPEDAYAASNLVASEDGFIEMFEGVKGNIVVNLGDFVRAGDLLVSGLYDSKTWGYRYVRSGGKVFARVEKDIEVEIPLEYDKKVYTGREFVVKYLIFFEKEIKIFGNTGNRFEMYDIIDTEEYANLLSGGDLPVGIRTVRCVEYTLEKAQRSPESAAGLAFYKLNLAVASAAGEGDLLRKTTAVERRPDACVLKCRIEYVKNIALVKEILIGELN